MLVEYINIGALCAVEGLQKGIAGLQEEGCEMSQYDRLLQGCVIEGYGWCGWCHAACSLRMVVKDVQTICEACVELFL
jgi:hypothetical protein